MASGTAIFPIVMFCRRRKASAPRRMAPEIFCISAGPWSCFRTHFARIAAITRPKMLTPKMIVSSIARRLRRARSPPGAGRHEGISSPNPR